MPDEDILSCCLDEWAASTSKRARKRETAAAPTAERSPWEPGVAPGPEVGQSTLEAATGAPSGPCRLPPSIAQLKARITDYLAAHP
jgi:hypothetical protein